MDFHPLVIHYPIAFLTTYAAFELARFQKLTSLSYWFYIKCTLVVVGELGAIATVIAAFLSTSTLAGESALADMYKLFIVITAIIFGLISLAYLKRLESFLKPQVIIPMTLIGLFFIVVAGGLFGATVYGTGYDPYLAPIFKLLGVY
jgi:uncharacterized membrane protein